MTTELHGAPGFVKRDDPPQDMALQGDRASQLCVTELDHAVFFTDRVCVTLGQIMCAVFSSLCVNSMRIYLLPVCSFQSTLT
jgi:hypothetical protein